MKNLPVRCLRPLSAPPNILAYFDQPASVMLQLPCTAADFPDIQVVPWTVPESVLMNMHNLTIIDAIYSCLNIDSLLALSMTSSKGRLSWIAYKQRIFNVIKMLSKFFKDPEGFREMQRKTGAVIIGDVPLLYFTRSAVGNAIFDVAVNPTHAQNVARQLVCMEGFSVWTGGHWGRDFDYAYSQIVCIAAQHTSHTADSHNPHYPPIDRHQPQSLIRTCSAGFTKHMMFEKISSDGNTSVVRVWIAVNGTPELILHSKSSQYERRLIISYANIHIHTAGIMNFITYKHAVSLYPNATLIHRRSYVLPMTPRSWQSAPPYPFLRTANMSECKGEMEVRSRRLYAVNDAPDLRMNIERHVGDRWSWSIRFDTKGKVIEDTESGDNDEGEHCLSRSRWVTKLWRNIPKVEVTCNGYVSRVP